MTLTR